MKPISWHVIKTASSFGFQNCCDVNSHDQIIPPMKVSCIRNKDVISFNLVRGTFPTLSYIKNCITGTCDDKCKCFYARLLKKKLLPYEALLRKYVSKREKFLRVIKFLAPTKQLLKCQHDIPFILHELRMKMKVQLKHVAEKLS